MRNTYRDYFIAKNGAEKYNMLVEDTKERYGYESDDYAEEEVICDALVALQKKKGFAEDMAKSLYENGYSKSRIRKFFRTVAEFFKKMSSMIRSMLDERVITKAGAYAVRDAALLDKLSDSFFAGMRKVSEFNFDGVDGETRKMLVGKNKDDIEVYETSNDILNLTWKERVKLFENKLVNEYSNKKARFTRNGHVYYAGIDQTNPVKSLYGENRFSKNEKKAYIKSGADGDYFNLIENADYDYSSKDRKNHKLKDGFTDYFDYFVKTVQIDNKVYDVNVTIKKQYGTLNGYTYTLYLKNNKKIKASPAVTKINGLKMAGNASNIIIPENSDLSTENKKKMLPEEQAELDRLKSELERKDAELSFRDNELEKYYKAENKETSNKIAAEDDLRYLEAVKNGDMATAQAMVEQAARENGYDSPVLYHGTENFGHTIFEPNKKHRNAIFLSNRLRVASTYSLWNSTREIGNLNNISAEDYVSNLSDSEIVEKLNYFSSIYAPGNEYSLLFGGFSVFDKDTYKFASIDYDATKKELIKYIEKHKQDKRGIYALYAKLGKTLTVITNRALYYKINVKSIMDAELVKSIISELGINDSDDYYLETDDIANYAKKYGYNSVMFKNILDMGPYANYYSGWDQMNSNVYAVFNPSQIKSADTVTYDDNGNIIPLSERFNENERDIRRMLPEEQAELDRLNAELEEKEAELEELKSAHEEYVKSRDEVNKAQKNMIDALKKSLVQGRGGAVVSLRSVQNIIRDLNERFGLKLNLSDDASSLTEIYSRIANAKNTNSAEFISELKDFVEKRVIPSSYRLDDSLRRRYKGFANDMRAGVRLNDNQISELCHLTGLPWGKARQKYFGRINFSYER